MATYNYTDRRNYLVRRYRKNYLSCDATWLACKIEDTADVVTANPDGYVSFGGWYTYHITNMSYTIYRALCTYNLSGLSAGDVTTAYLESEGGYVAEAEGVNMYMYDGTGVSLDVSGYGQIADLTTLLGEVHIPNGFYVSDPWAILFNAAGIAFLKSKAGGSAKIAFRSEELTPPGNCPTTPEGRELLHLAWTGDGKTHQIVISSAEGGYRWVEGEDWAYLDAFRTKRLTTGALTGGSGDPGYRWADGTYWYYTDSSGNVRRIEGTLTGLTGKIPGQSSVNTNQGGTKFCYIDSSGAERCFEGTAV